MNDVLLLSGSIPALAAALDLAAVGIRVCIAEGVRAEMPREAVRDANHSVSGFLNELAAPLANGGTEAPGARPTTVPPAPIALRSRDGSWKPQPEPSVWGIPTVPLSSDCIDLLGTRTAIRAYLDRVKPVLTIGKQENLAKLVDSRLGRKSRQLLVEPVVYERFGVPADQVDVGLIAPGLNEALTRTGSLSGAALDYFERHVARETLTQPVNGWEELGELLFGRLELFGADHLGAPLTELVATGDGGEWAARDEAGTQYSFAALVLDGGAMVEGTEALDVTITSLSRARTRIHAVVGIEAPSFDSLQAGERDAVELCEDSQGATWSARTRHSNLAGWVTVLRSAARESVQAAPGDTALNDLVEGLGFTPTGSSARVEIEPASYAMHSESEADAEAFAVWQEAHPTVLLSGVAYFGGELAPALADARKHAVLLRRRLTGVA